MHYVVLGKSMWRIANPMRTSDPDSNSRKFVDKCP